MRDSRVIDDESTSNERCDWLAENDIISENERTIGWYSSVSARLRPSGILKWYLRKITKTLLIANQQWILASTLTGDPIVEFSEVQELYLTHLSVSPPDHRFEVLGGNGMFITTIVVAGEVVGTWARTTKPREIVVVAKPFTTLTSAAMKKFERAVASYGAFVGKPVRTI